MPEDFALFRFSKATYKISIARAAFAKGGGEVNGVSDAPYIKTEDLRQASDILCFFWMCETTVVSAQ